MTSSTKDEPATKIYVVEVDTRESGMSADYNSYKETVVDSGFWERNILHNKNVISIPSTIANLCGLDIKLYVAKSKISKGFGECYQEGGNDAVNQFLMVNPTILQGNNGAATFLLVDPESGYANKIVKGKAYVVCDGGRTKLTRGQVWGLQEMVNCAMDIYDGTEVNRRRGKEAIERWANQYVEKTWVPRSGTGGVDIYADGILRD
jgi:hypothetical protein